MDDHDEYKAKNTGGSEFDEYNEWLTDVELTEPEAKQLYIAHLAKFAIMLFFIGISIAMLTGCGLKYRLPDRSHPSCQVPYSQRPTCLEDSDCAQNFLCAYRGGFSSIEGRCTYIDCCDPWRNRRLEGGRSFCDIDINPDIINGRKPVRNKP